MGGTATTLSPHDLVSVIGTADCPRLFDVRRAEAFAEAEDLIPTARWRDHRSAATGDGAYTAATAQNPEVSLAELELLLDPLTRAELAPSVESTSSAFLIWSSSQRKRSWLSTSGLSTPS